MTPPSSSVLIERVIQVISTGAQIPADEINENTAIEDLDIDSLGFLGIVGDLEDEFDVEIPNERAFRITNLPELIACLQELIEEQSSGSGEERPA